MNWSFLLSGEFMLIGGLVLPLLFLELFLLRRSQRRDRAARRAARRVSEQGAGHAEGEHRLDR